MLAAGRDRMRVVFPEQVGVLLENESGHVVEIAALIPIAGADCSQICAEVYPKTMSAGRSFTV